MAAERSGEPMFRNFCTAKLSFQADVKRQPVQAPDALNWFCADPD